MLPPLADGVVPPSHPLSFDDIPASGKLTIAYCVHPQDNFAEISLEEEGYKAQKRKDGGKKKKAICLYQSITSDVPMGCK